MLLVFIRMCLYLIVCYSYVTRMLLVCYSYVLVCYSYVTRMLLVCYSYVAHMLLVAPVCSFSHDRDNADTVC